MESIRYVLLRKAFVLSCSSVTRSIYILLLGSEPKARRNGWGWCFAEQLRVLFLEFMCHMWVGNDHFGTRPPAICAVGRCQNKKNRSPRVPWGMYLIVQFFSSSLFCLCAAISLHFAQTHKENLHSVRNVHQRGKKPRMTIHSVNTMYLLRL